MEMTVIGIHRSSCDVSLKVSFLGKNEVEEVSSLSTLV